jgi:hypothetical protein
VVEPRHTKRSLDEEEGNLGDGRGRRYQGRCSLSRSFTGSTRATMRRKREVTTVNRASLEEQFEIAAVSGTQTKTFVIEAHANGEPGQFLSELAVDGRVSPTDDVHLHVLHEGDLEFWVDHLDGRFWSFHTWSPAADARRYLKEQVERRRDLDWAWLPSSHLSRVWPGTRPKWLRCDFRGERFLPEDDRARRLQIQILGEGSEELLGLISGREAYASAVSVDQAAIRAVDPAFGVVNELVNRTGRFVVTGNSFALHQEVVRGVISRYRRLVERAETRLLKWDELDGGGVTVHGAPISINLSRSIPDLDVFLSELFSCREPFRLWGIPEVQKSIAEVEAVDLHVGQRLRFEVGPTWIRVFLYSGGCGNSIARLVSNLQHSYDASLSLSDGDLAEALSL